MRPVILAAFLSQISKLQAEEDLRLISAVAAGSGTMSKPQHGTYMNSLSKRAGIASSRGGTLHEQLGMEVVLERVEK